MKTPPEYTPWQLWAQTYHDPMWGGLGDEDADRYAHAAWEECRKRCLAILEKHAGHGTRETWIREEMEAL